MTSNSSEICVDNFEPKAETEANSLVETAKRIGFSSDEIAELNRIYAIRRKVKK